MERILKKIVIFGAGYVGLVTGVSFATLGHEVTFIDINQEKIDLINRAKCPIYEPDLGKYLEKGIENGSIHASTKLDAHLKEADVAFVCVGTPSLRSGDLNTTSIAAVLHEIQSGQPPSNLIVAIRSTIYPDNLRTLLDTFPKELVDQLVVNPEFLRESTALKDFFHPPFLVIGSNNVATAKVVATLYDGIETKIHFTDLATACLLKYACNAFHAAKVVFANEISSIAAHLDIDATHLMKIFCEDKILNCSPAYLKPGFAFGGSCLPKDLRALCFHNKKNCWHSPLLSSILESNELLLKRTSENIADNDHKTLMIIGLSFKQHTDDMRESPFIRLAHSLVEQGITIKAYDPDIDDDSPPFGANRICAKSYLGYQFIEKINDLNATIPLCDGFIICKKIICEESYRIIQETGSPIYDLNHHYTTVATSNEYTCEI